MAIMNNIIDRIEHKETDAKKGSINLHNEILSNITHDLKSPMTAIIGFSRYLKSEIEADGGHALWVKRLDRILNAGDQVVGMINDIMAMAKIEAGKEPVELKRIFNLELEFNDMLSTFELEAKAKGIELEILIKNALPEVVWDMRRLRLHAFNNIISNALKFTPIGGKVIVTAEDNKHGITVLISDSGPGIPQNELSRIFTRLEQLDMKSGRVMLGAGLGLSNARTFIERHGGSISARNNQSGVGATFIIKLPYDSC